MSAVRVVPARPDDARDISDLECRRENRSFIRGHSEAEHRSRMGDPTVRYLRVEDDAGKLIGFALVRAGASCVRGSWFGYPHHPSHLRGDGGTAPLVWMELWARDRIEIAKP